MLPAAACVCHVQCLPARHKVAVVRVVTQCITETAALQASSWQADQTRKPGVGSKGQHAMRALLSYCFWDLPSTCFKLRETYFSCMANTWQHVSALLQQVPIAGMTAKSMYVRSCCLLQAHHCVKRTANTWEEGGAWLGVRVGPGCTRCSSKGAPRLSC
jgi:hypothetical protein